MSVIVTCDWSAPKPQPPISFPFLWRSRLNNVVYLRTKSDTDVAVTGDSIGDIFMQRGRTTSDAEAWLRRLDPTDRITLQNRY